MKDGGSLEYGVRDIPLPGWRPNHVKRCPSLDVAKAWAKGFGGKIVVRGVSRWRYLEDEEICPDSPDEPDPCARESEGPHG